jgi:hypothetical protein
MRDHSPMPVIPTRLYLFGVTRKCSAIYQQVKLTTNFPPDMDAAFFLGLLAFADAVYGQRVSMGPTAGARLMAMQTASESALLLAPRCGGWNR